MRTKRTIQNDIFDASITASKAIEQGKLFVEAQEVSKTINHFVFNEIFDLKPKQRGFVIGDLRRYLNVLEMEFLEEKKRHFEQFGCDRE